MVGAFNPFTPKVPQHAGLTRGEHRGSRHHFIPLGRPSAPAPSIQYRASNLDWQLFSYMIFYSCLPLECCAGLCLVTQSCLTLCNPMDCNPPGSSVCGIFRAVGEGEGGKIWENGIETCKISCMKRVASPGSMHDTGCLGLVHWDDPEGWNG